MRINAGALEENAKSGARVRMAYGRKRLGLSHGRRDPVLVELPMAFRRQAVWPGAALATAQLLRRREDRVSWKRREHSR
jgi:hypothetical protein